MTVGEFKTWLEENKVPDTLPIMLYIERSTTDTIEGLPAEDVALKTTEAIDFGRGGWGINPEQLPERVEICVHACV
jgi:hypothetical protein